MYQAIETKFFGPTNHRGGRVKATCQARSITVSWDHALNVEDNHTAAAQALAHKMDWAGDWIGGAKQDGTGYAFVHGATAFSVKR
jgi:hypothetical protein